jgi:hypothetical protein
MALDRRGWEVELERWLEPFLALILAKALEDRLAAHHVTAEL